MTRSAHALYPSNPHPISQMTHENALLLQFGYITEPKPTPHQIAATEAARVALAKFRHQWKVTPAPTR